MSSNSVCDDDWETSMVEPSSSGLPVPRVSSRYLSPNDDLYLTLTSVSAGSGSTVLSSLRSSFAIALPSSSVVGVICSTTPTRAPPMRTSLLGAMREALGSSTEIR